MEKIWKTNNTLRESDIEWEYYDDSREDFYSVTAADFDSYCHFVFVLESEEAINAIKEIIELTENEQDREKLERYSKEFLDTVLEYLEKKEIKEVACSFLDPDFTYRDWFPLERKLEAEHKSFIELDVNVDGADIKVTPYYPATYDSPSEGGYPYETSLGEDGTPTLAEALEWSEVDWLIDELLFDAYFA